MCYLLHIMVGFSCGHIYLERRQKVECHSKTCAVSASHERQEHECEEKCTQRLGNAQELVRESLNYICDRCRLGA
ncbi:hypothetical protein CPB84DRAFT_1798932 [Gymnopilus junonius]|uniref:Uncharacterized protein n=1 Tax=Gymnopilus junonius TaxID=109634 RepID=A0A9P5N811_GYMJU|nr:hypothetical protein CPB84DRAFT_1798932 [Gymnopilus junonius]